MSDCPKSHFRHVMLHSFVASIPPLFIIFLITLSYYTYVIQFCTYFLTSLTKKTLYIIFYHVLLLVFLWCYLHTVFKTHKPIPQEYRLTLDEHDRLATYSEDEASAILKKMIKVRNLEIYTCAPNGKIRYCKACMLIKPDRTHHCSSCQKCILKMDHHCPWIANCVGFCNHKLFVLMLFYGTIWSMFFFGTVAEHYSEIFQDFEKDSQKIILGTGSIVMFMVGTLLAILLMYHIGLISRNETTLEALRDCTFIEDNKTFDLGQWSNFRQVFGDNLCCWLFPVHSAKGNGHEFQLRQIIT